MTNDYRALIRLKQLSIGGLRLVFAIISLLLILAGSAYLTNQINCTNCPLRSKYEGRVINKSLTFSESQFGSGIRRRLLIESNKSEKFEVYATEPVFNQAKIGDWIKADEKRIEISEKPLP